MNKLLSHLQLSLLTVSGLLLLCIVFSSAPELANSAISGKLCWFQLIVLLLAGSTLFMEFTIKKSRFTFSIPDALLLLLFGTVIITYDIDLNLQPEKLLFICQLVMLWFMLRTIMQKHMGLRITFLIIIMFTGFFESILGIEYLHEAESFDHPLLKQFEYTFSQEFFTGYMAIILPLCLSIVLRLSNCSKLAWWETKTVIYYLSWTCFILIVTALHAGMNRYAWISAIIASIWVCWIKLVGWEKTKKIIRSHNKSFMALTLIIFTILALLPEIKNRVKADPFDKRILIWNITTKAILKHPVTGTGLGGFSATYAQTQAEYFSTDTATKSEKEIACCMDSPHNEYLFIGLELGILGLLLFCLWLVFSLYYGILHRQTGATGAIVALAIYAMYSSPLQHPSFWILLIFLTAICTTKPKHYPDSNNKCYPYIGALAALVAIILFFAQKDSYRVYKEWNALKSIYHDQNYAVAVKGYTCLYPRLNYKVDFLLEGARCLTHTGQYEEAVIWLEQGMLRSANPSLYEEMAKNKFLLGKYSEAETHLREIIEILPGRIYPYYLLAKLYADPSYFNPEKLKYAAEHVLSIQAATDSQITEEMRKEINNILNEK